MPKMRIIVDMQPAARLHRSGIGVYTAYLVEQLAKNNPDKVEVVGHYYNFLGRQRINSLPRAANIRYKVSRLIPVKAVNALRRLGLNLPFEILTKSRGALHFFPDCTLRPSLFGTPSVVAIHDLAFLDMPETLSQKNRADLFRFVPTAVEKAWYVITISNFTRARLIHHYKLDAHKITVINPAVDHGQYYRRTESEIESVRKRFDLPKRYLLYLGTLEPRKNVEGILRAYQNLDEETKKNNALVLAGGRGWRDESIQQTIKEMHQTNEKVIIPGYIADSDKPALYSGATLFIYPSHYEGFGIPPLEAMACGVPIITADNSSLPEVVGEAAIKLQAEDTAAITKAMADVLSNPKLAEELRQKGIKQAQKFNWDKSAAAAIALFDRLKTD